MKQHVRAIALAASAAVIVASGVASASPPVIDRGGPGFYCQDNRDQAINLAMDVEGETATGRYTLPKGKAKGLVVFAHGYGHTSASWVEHMRKASRDHGVIAVTMDYRGIKISPDSNKDGLPESRGWNAMKGAEDLVAVTQFFEERCRSIEKITLLGVSMGANMSGLAVALSKDAQRTDGSPLFDYWIDVEGAVNVIETYLGARALAPFNEFAANAQEDIEKEMGGPIEENPEAYERRAVVRRIDDIKASGVEGVVVIHGLDDGLVPYNQGREMAGLLAQAQIPTDMFTIGRKSPESESETTATGYVGGQLDPDYRSPLAGHASEKSQTHIVMVTAFERLWSIMDDDEAPGPYREFMVDGELGTFPTL